MSVQTVRPSALPLPKSLSSSAPSVPSSVAGSGTINSKGIPTNDRVRAGSTTPPSNGPLTRSTIPVLYNHRSIAMIPRVAASGLPHKNSHKTIGIPNGGMSTSVNITIKKPLNSPTSQPSSSYWRFGQSKGGVTMTAGSREIIRRHSARASVSGDSGNVTPQSSSPVTALRKISNCSSTTDYGSRKISTCSTDSNMSSYSRKVSSDSTASVTSSTKPNRKLIVGANSFGAGDTKTKKQRRSVTSDNREKSADLQVVINKLSSVSKNDELAPCSVDDLERKEETPVNLPETITDGVPGKKSSEARSTKASSMSPSRSSIDSKLNNSVSSELTTSKVTGSNTSTTITVKTKGKELFATCYHLINDFYILTSDSVTCQSLSFCFGIYNRLSPVHYDELLLSMCCKLAKNKFSI